MSQKIYINTNSLGTFLNNKGVEHQRFMGSVDGRSVVINIPTSQCKYFLEFKTQRKTLTNYKISNPQELEKTNEQLGKYKGNQNLPRIFIFKVDTTTLDEFISKKPLEAKEEE